MEIWTSLYYLIFTKSQFLHHFILPLSLSLFFFLLHNTTLSVVFGTLVNHKENGKYIGSVFVRSDLSVAKLKCKHIKRHGRGSMFYTDGSRYFGYWKDNRVSLLLFDS